MKESGSARQISLVERLVIPFQSSIVHDALALGDIDNDGYIELAVGTIDGDLEIFKGDSLIASKHEMGTIKCLFIADFLELGYSCVVVLSAEGLAYIVDFITGDQKGAIMTCPIPWNVTAAVQCELSCFPSDRSRKNTVLVVASHDGGALSQSTISILSLSLVEEEERKIHVVQTNDWCISQGAVVSDRKSVV